MAINFTRKAYLEVWRENRYISRHTGLIEAGESASKDADKHGSGDYFITIGGPPESFTEIRADGLAHNVPAGKVYYMARADATVFFSSNLPAFARPAGARIAAQSSAVAAGSSGALSVTAPVTGAGSSVSTSSVSVFEAQLAMSAKRYDGGSGTAVFSGVVPFQESQVTVAGLSNISIFDGLTELPIAVVDSELRHPDGSVKAAQVHTQLSAADQVEVPLTLQLGLTPTAGTVTPVVVDKNWMVNPVLLACTDATHLCKSHIAIGPLVPLSTMTALGMTDWVTTFTTEWDSKSAQGLIGMGWPKDYFDRDDQTQGWPLGSNQNADYNVLYGMYCKYLVSGDIDDLYYANGIAGWDAGCQWTMGEHSHQNDTITDTDTSAVFGVNPDYADPPGQANGQPLTMSEQHSGSARDAYLCWALSGWRQARGVGVAWGMRNVLEGTNSATQYGGRVDFRWYREYGAFLKLYNIDQRLTYFVNNGPPPIQAEAASNTTWWANFYQSNYFDTFEAWSLTMTPGDPRYNIWGFESGFDSAGELFGVPGLGIPLFQYESVFATIFNLEMNAHQDTGGRTWDQLEALADYVHSKIRGPFTSSFNGYDCYTSAYATESTPPTGENNEQYVPSMLTPLFAWAYAKTGEQRYLDIIDQAATQRHWVTAGGSSGNGWKQQGEFWSFLFHAAAWRAGVTHNGWDL